MVHGKKGTKAGDGGDGGKQGHPGLAGKILLFELDQAAKLKTFANDGKYINSDSFREILQLYFLFFIK